VAHAGWHRPLGRWALPWGFVLGTLPDLDVLANPWLDAVERLHWHRGPSHGIPGVVAMALISAVVVWWIHRRGGLSWARAWVTALAIMVTHVAIDLFTVYGTQILAPFSDHGFGTDNLFIIDPLYTVPLLLGVCVALLCGGRWGARANLVGLVLSTLYVGWSFGAQAKADAVFQRALAQQGHAVERTLTSATPLNTVLWRGLAQVEGGFLVGYWSLLDEDESVRFDFVPQRAELVADVRDTRAFEVVDWFSQGWWVADERGGRVRMSDLRFGEIRSGANQLPEEWAHVFSWHVGPDAADPSGLEQLPQVFADRSAALGMVWSRLRGDRTGW
jgi:inner membrane protein